MQPPSSGSDGTRGAGDGYLPGEDERTQPSLIPVPPLSSPAEATPELPGHGAPHPNPNHRRNVLLVATACVVALVLAIPLIIWVSSGTDGSGSAARTIHDTAGGTPDSESMKGVRSARGRTGSTSEPGGVIISTGPSQAAAAGPAVDLSHQASGAASSTSAAGGSASGGSGSGGSGTDGSASGGSGLGGSSPNPRPSPTPKPSPKPSSPPAPSPNPYTPAQVCGAGYSQIDQRTLTGGTAKIYLLYNGSRNCVVTMKYGTGVGTAESMSAWVQVEGASSRQSDSGSYKYYAGPVYVYAPQKCVKWGGSYGGASWGSGWEHCG